MTIYFYIGACFTGLLGLNVGIILIGVLQFIAKQIDNPILSIILISLSYGLFVLILVALLLAHVTLWLNLKNLSNVPGKTIFSGPIDMYNGCTWMIRQIKQALYKSLTFWTLFNFKK